MCFKSKKSGNGSVCLCSYIPYKHSRPLYIIFNTCNSDSCNCDMYHNVQGVVVPIVEDRSPFVGGCVAWVGE